MRVKYLNFKEQWVNESKQLLPIINKTLASGKYVGVNSEVVLKFENKISKICKTKNCISLNSGTDALTLALFANGISKGDEVITVSNSYIATVGSIVHLKAKPIFVDVNDNLNINPSLIENKITKRTKAIIPVHLTGRMCDMKKINNIAKRNNLVVIEDAAQSFGAKFKKKICGSYNNITCFSAHPLKNLNAMGDAGFMTLNNNKLATRIFRLKNHGLRNRDNIDEFGYNSRLDSLQASVLNFRLSRYQKYIELRRANAKIYNSIIDKSYALLPLESEDEFNTYHTYIIQIPNRKKLISYLKNNNIDTYIHYPVPAHMQKYYLKNYRERYNLPKTTKQSKSILSLPINHSLSNKKIEYVANKVNYFLRNLS